MGGLGWMMLRFCGLKRLAYWTVDLWTFQNLVLTVANVVPLAMLDGGKVFHGIFAVCMSHQKAGMAVALLGLAMAPYPLYCAVILRDWLDVMIYGVLTAVTFGQTVYFICLLCEVEELDDEERREHPAIAV